MKRLLPIMLLGVSGFAILLGCQPSTTEFQTAVADAVHEAELAKAAAYDSAQTEQNARPASSDLSNIDDFCEVFRLKFNEDKAQAFAELGYWAGVSSQARAANMKIFLSTEHFIAGLDGKLQGTVGVLDFAEYGSFVNTIRLPGAFILEPTHIISAYVVNADGNATAVYYPLAEADGRFYICPAFPQ